MPEGIVDVRSLDGVNIILHIGITKREELDRGQFLMEMDGMHINNSMREGQQHSRLL